jgi:hypothetical protein
MIESSLVAGQLETGEERFGRGDQKVTWCGKLFVRSSPTPDDLTAPKPRT